MIFLFKDSTFKVYPPDLPEKKLVKKFLRRENEIKAVLVESSTRLRSDTYVLVETDHFKTKIEPFDIEFSMFMGEVDTPPDLDTNVVHRVVRVDSIHGFYSAATLIYQLDASEDCGDFYNLGMMRPYLMELIFHMPDGDIKWDFDKESATEFINRQGMFCDTDHFLDAAIGVKPTRQEMLENGCYVLRKDKSDGTVNLQYYYHGARHILWMKDRFWHLFGDTVLPRIDSLVTAKVAIDELYGICINHTGLLYIATYPFLINYREIDECSVSMYTGHWETIEDKTNQIRFQEPILDENEHYSVAYNPTDALYMAVYLPQFWDIQRFLYGDTPVKVACEFLQRKCYRKTGEINIKPLDANQALHFDLFKMMAQVFNLPPRDISFDER